MDYLKYLWKNQLGNLLAIYTLIWLFMAYWIISEGWEDSKHDIYLGLGTQGVVLVFYLLGTYINYKTRDIGMGGNEEDDLLNHNH